MAVNWLNLIMRKVLLRVFCESTRSGPQGKDLDKSGFEKVREHYSVARMADRALEAYESVLSAKSGAGASPPSRPER